MLPREVPLFVSRKYARFVPELLVLLLASATLTPALAQYVQQGPKLVGTGGIGYSKQGLAVAISADGNTAVVGGPFDGNTSDIYSPVTNPNVYVYGAIWFFERIGNVWIQQGTKQVDTTGFQQGVSVALSADGNTALVGDQEAPDGAALVFTRSNGAWSEEAKLIGQGGVGSPYEGRAVALSADGNTAIVGGAEDNFAMGAAWIFVRSNGVWSQQGPKLVGSEDTATPGEAFQGSAVAISQDGNTVAIGGPFDDDSTGAVWVFPRANGAWLQQGPKLVASDGTGAQQGTSVALSSDGNTLAVGGPTESPGGAAWVFNRINGFWYQQGSKLVDTGFVPELVPCPCPCAR